MERSKISCKYANRSMTMRVKTKKRKGNCLENKEPNSTCRVMPRALADGITSERVLLIQLGCALYCLESTSWSVNRLSNSICTGIIAAPFSLLLCNFTVWLIVKAPLTKVHFFTQLMIPLQMSNWIKWISLLCPAVKVCYITVLGLWACRPAFPPSGTLQLLGSSLGRYVVGIQWVTGSEWCLCLGATDISSEYLMMSDHGDDLS